MRHLTTADGLSSNTVQCIAQDAQGFLWLGTQDGLSRYDGSSFRPFRADARRVGSLPSNFVRALAPDPRRGGLWVGTGLSYYDPRTERFGSVAADSGQTYFVNALLLDARGCVWLGTEDGLWCYEPAHRQLRRFRLATPGVAASAGRHTAVRALTRDAAGTLWAGTGEGQLCRFDPATRALWPELRYQPPGSAPVSALAGAPGGGLWVGGGSLRYLPPAGPARALLRPGSPAVRDLWVDARGNAWVGTATELSCWAATPAATRPIRRLAGEVLALGPDHAGQLWVGSNAGVRCLDAQPSAFARLPAGPAPGPVWAVAATPRALWLGTEQQGLLALDPRTGAITERLRHQPAHPASLADDFVRCVLPDAAGGLWVGTQHQGLDYRPAGATGFRHFRHAAARPGSLADDFVRCLYRDPLDGALWVGTEGGLCRLNNAVQKEFTTYRREASRPGGLPNNFVRCVLRDRAGRLWVGTGGGGLCRLDDARAGRFTTFRATARDAHSLPSNFVRALALDAAGRLWVGTEGGGLCRADRAPLLYQLEGFDPGWLAAGARREATYTNLDPGSYTFRVRAAGAPAALGAARRLVMAPPWYGTWWFRALVVGTLGLAGWLAYLLRINQLLALEQVRHRIARDLPDDMGSTLSSISILSALARQHQLGQRPAQAADLLGQIGDPSRRMLDAMDNIVWTINPAHDGLADVTARMRALASELLEVRGGALVFESDPAVAALRLPMNSRREFFLFYKEALNNLAKYAHCRQATVALTYADGYLPLLVADDGVGFDPAAAPQGGGHGLSNLRARAAALRGHFTLVTAPGQGTTVRLRVPL